MVRVIKYWHRLSRKGVMLHPRKYLRSGWRVFEQPDSDEDVPAHGRGIGLNYL